MTGIDPSSPREALIPVARTLLGIIALIGAVCTGIAVITLPRQTSASAHAQSCPDVEVIFARGTFEPPGVGVTGQSFVDALQNRLGDRTIEVYPVDYPASLDFSNGAAQGIVDARNKVTDIAAQCPTTHIVTGGYSQGAAVAAYLTADSVPAKYPLPKGITGPLPPDIARHIAAVALFGKPSSGFLNFLVHDAPPITIGHLYADKTIELCVSDDPVCSPTGHDQSAHNTYAGNGMADQAADFAAHRVYRVESTRPMTSHALIGYIAIVLLITITPGPDTAIVLRNAIRQGTKAGTSTAAGSATGLLVWAVAAALGLAALLSLSAHAFDVVKIGGAAYLIYLGIRMIWSALNTRPNTDAEQYEDRKPKTPSSRRAFRQGLGTNLLNPKAAVFFTAVVPQFVPHPGLAAVPQVFGLALIAVTASFTGLSLVALAGHRAAESLQRKNVERIVDTTTGSILIALGSKLALSQGA